MDVAADREAGQAGGDNAIGIDPRIVTDPDSVYRQNKRMAADRNVLSEMRESEPGRLFTRQKIRRHAASRSIARIPALTSWTSLTVISSAMGRDRIRLATSCVTSRGSAVPKLEK